MKAWFINYKHHNNKGGRVVTMLAFVVSISNLMGGDLINDTCLSESIWGKWKPDCQESFSSCINAICFFLLCCKSCSLIGCLAGRGGMVGGGRTGLASSSYMMQDKSVVYIWYTWYDWRSLLGFRASCWWRAFLMAFQLNRNCLSISLTSRPSSDSVNKYNSLVPLKCLCVTTLVSVNSYPVCGTLSQPYPDISAWIQWGSHEGPVSIVLSISTELYSNPTTVNRLVIHVPAAAKCS